MFYLYFFIILILAITFRILCLDKTSGLWYDELLLYNQANLNSCIDIIKYVLHNDLNLPLYQIFLHFWIKIFGNSDFCLRLFSALLGILTCITAFFISDNKKNNLLCMLLFGVNSFLIYYSQDVKIFSLVTFLTTLNLVSLIKIYERDKGYILWFFSSAMLVLTYTTAFLYIFIEIVIFFFYRLSKKFLITSALLSITFIPIIYTIFKNIELYSSNSNWFYSDKSTFLLVFQNFFSPKLTCLDSISGNYISYLINNSNLIFSIILIIIPVLISFFFILKSLKNDKTNQIIFIIALGFYFSYFIAFNSLHISVLSRYLIIILPNLLIILARGFKFDKLSISLITIFFLINGSYLIFAKDSAFKINRSGYRNVANFIMQESQNGDNIILRANPDIINKYLNKKLYTISLLDDFAYKSEFFIENSMQIEDMPTNEKKEFIKNYFYDDKIPQNIVIMYSLMNILTKTGNKIFIVIMKQFDNYTTSSYKELISNSKKYNQNSFTTLLTIKTLLNIKELCNKNLKFIKKVEIDDFVIYEYQKN